MRDSQTNNSTVMFWNVWGYRYPYKLHQFMLKNAPEVDIFCLTEVTDVNESDLVSGTSTLKFNENLQEAPSNVDGQARLKSSFGGNYIYKYDSSKRSDWTCEKTGTLFPQVGFGSMLMYHRRLRVIATGSQLLCEGIEDIRPRVVQWIVYEKAGVRYLLLHFHGIWIAHNTKGDDSARNVQSAEFLQLIKIVTEQNLVDKIIFGGDFNLDIDTEALALLKDLCAEGAGGGPFRNLIDEFGIQNTRTPQYRKWQQAGESLYADYAFAGPNVVVNSLRVHTDVHASDHAPLLVTFQ
jgi:endonuclease/exonuclease/phosphatase family metal-dependent hydrolase